MTYKTIKMYLSLLSLLMTQTTFSQSIVEVGKGSYASYTPLINCRSTVHTPDAYGYTGDQSRYMQYRKLYVKEQEGRAIPTNDWWTNLITEQYSGNLWSYPQMIRATKDGVDIQRPSFWIENGTEIKSNTILHLSGVDFAPQAAIATDWHDWDVEFTMNDAEKKMNVTMAHGMPFTWIETTGIEPVLKLEVNGWISSDYNRDASVEILSTDGTAVANGTKLSAFAIKKGTDVYGIYLPQNTTLNIIGNNVSLQFAGTEQYIVVGVLTETADLQRFMPYAYSVPRSTTVSWNYDNKAGKVRTHWHVEAESLNNSPVQVLQGFLPHQYRDTGNAPSFAFISTRFVTPHGELRMAEGTDFDIDYNFYGMLPYYAMPNDTTGTNAFFTDRMVKMLTNYADNGSFGYDTYWGGKGLTQMALYMMFAREMGDTETFLKCRKRLKETLVDWYTFTPGESNRFFARYDRWGGLVGYSTSYDSDTFNDHHFHYGYFTLASALLAMVDDDFRQNYGQMARLLVKDYANWQHEDTNYPFFRTFDPWAGHSFAGGMGDGNGNGQESSSESMQAWGGMYLLGVALGDDEMRDAGLFGWVSEARGVAEYWFDRHEDPAADYTVENYHTKTLEGYNIPYSKFISRYSVDGVEKSMTPPYNSNLTCHGVGWWTYFGYDAIFMQGIQWMPISPALDYLSENKQFAAWDYARLMHDKLLGGWHADTKTSAGYLGDSGGWGNVALSYLQRSNPDEAAAIFDECWNQGDKEFTEFNTNGITYFVTHSHRSHGDLDWTVTADYPTARAYNKNGTRTYQIYNPTNENLTVTFSDGYSQTVKPHDLFISDFPNRNAVGYLPSDKITTNILDSIGMENLALHKTCLVSGYENVGTLAEYATDGNLTTRWGSKHLDGEWISVDLGESAELYKLSLRWETAYASNYTIQVSADGKTWQDAQEVISDGGQDVVMMNNVKARYIKILGNKRATPYGISLYEIEAYGKRESLTDNDVLGMMITADSDVLKQNQVSKLTAKGYTVGGQWVDINVNWQSADGDITARGEFTPRKFDLVKVKASTSAFSVEKQFAVEEAFVMQKFAATPAVADYAIGGDDIVYTFETKDQFGGPIAIDNTNLKAEVYAIDAQNNFSATANATFDSSTNQLKAFKAGEYAVVFSAETLKDTAFVHAKAFSEVNLALHKPAKATTENGGSTALLATDGLTSTRWESSWANTGEELTVDLKAVYHINKVRILWENACAKNYEIQVSLDGAEYATVGLGGVTTGGWNELMLNPVGGEILPEVRFVKLKCVEKQLTAYGYSLFEFEVYGTDKVRDVVSTVKNIIKETSDTGYSITGVRMNKADFKKGVYIVNSNKYIVK